MDRSSPSELPGRYASVEAAEVLDMLEGLAAEKGGIRESMLTKLLGRAAKITGEKYRRNESGRLLACADLRAHICACILQ